MRSKIKNATRIVWSNTDTIKTSEISISCEDSILGRAALHGHAGFLIFSNLLLEEVGLSLQRDVFHEVKRVVGVVELLTLQLHQQPVRHELDVLHHEICVHPCNILTIRNFPGGSTKQTYQTDWQSFGEKLALDVHGVSDDLVNPLSAGLVDQVTVHQAGKVSVETFIPGDQFVAEGETRHQTSLLQPENGSETAGEENPLH